METRPFAVRPARSNRAGIDADDAVKQLSAWIGAERSPDSSPAGSGESVAGPMGHARHACGVVPALGTNKDVSRARMSDSLQAVTRNGVCAVRAAR